MGFRSCGLPGCKSLRIFRISERPGGRACYDNDSVRILGCNRNLVKRLSRFASAGIVQPRLMYSGEYYPEVVLVTTSAGQYFSLLIFMMYQSR